MAGTAVFICLHAPVSLCMCMCVYVCVYFYIYVSIHTHIHIPVHICVCMYVLCPRKNNIPEMMQRITATLTLWYECGPAMVAFSDWCKMLSCQFCLIFNIDKEDHLLQYWSWLNQRLPPKFMILLECLIFISQENYYYGFLAHETHSHSPNTERTQLCCS